MSQSLALACISGNPRHLNKSNKSWVSRWVFTCQSATCHDPNCSQPPQSKMLFCTCVPLFGDLLYLYLNFTVAAFPDVFSGHYRKTFLLLHWIIPSGTLKLYLPQRHSLPFSSDKTTSDNEWWHFLPQGPLALLCVTKCCCFALTAPNIGMPLLSEGKRDNKKNLCMKHFNLECDHGLVLCYVKNCFEFLCLLLSHNSVSKDYLLILNSTSKGCSIDFTDED